VTHLPHRTARLPAPAPAAPLPHYPHTALPTLQILPACRCALPRATCNHHYQHISLFLRASLPSTRLDGRDDWKARQFNACSSALAWPSPLPTTVPYSSRFAARQALYTACWAPFCAFSPSHFTSMPLLLHRLLSALPSTFFSILLARLDGRYVWHARRRLAAGQTWACAAAMSNSMYKRVRPLRCQFSASFSLPGGVAFFWCLSPTLKGVSRVARHLFVPCCRQT